MNPAELAALKERSCTGKTKMGPTRARNIAQRMRSTGDDVQPYACIFCPCWHVGHTMSWEGVETVAEAIRYRTHPEGAHIDREAS